MYDRFDVFLDSVSQDFIEYFCIDIHKRNWSEVHQLNQDEAYLIMMDDHF
jgi:hypothetical protein